MASTAPTLNVSPQMLRMTPDVGADGITLTVSNPAPDRSVLYKCKTTSPARYVVRNRQGVIAPNNKQTVLISMQRGVVITGEEQNDIFLVEARYLEPGEVEAASRTSDITSEMMKAKGRSAVAKVQVSCELSLGASAASKQRRNDAASEAQSNHTQPAALATTTATTVRDARQPSTAATPNAGAANAADPSPAPRDPTGAAPLTAPIRQATTSVRPAPAAAKKGGSSKLYLAAVVVVIAAVFWARSGPAAEVVEEAPAAPAPAAAAAPAAAEQKATAATEKKASKPAKGAKSTTTQ